MNGVYWRITRSILWILVLFAALQVTAPLLAADDNSYLPGEVVVKLFQNSDLVAVTADFQLDPLPLDQFGGRPIYRLRILDGMDPQTKADLLTGDSRVQYAEPNFLEETPEGRQRARWASGGSAGDYAKQWAGPKMRLATAHGVSRGAGVTVAVLDTGIDPNHPAFTGKLVAGYDFVNMDADPREEGNAEQNLAYGHGTHVAGLVALAAPDAKLMPIRVLDPEGAGNIWVLAEALLYAVDPDSNPATNDGAHVINLSLSTRRNTHLLENIIGLITCNLNDDAITGDDDDCSFANGRGAVVVAAVGNRASDLPEYPAAEGVNGLVAVAATNENDSLAPFSNYGDWAHVAAPGEQIISPVPGNSYGVWSGTSMATPLVAGQAALLRSVNPDWDAGAIVSQIVSTATDIGGSVPRRVDAAAALGVGPTNVLTVTGTAANDEIQLHVGPAPGEVVVLKAPGVADGARFSGIYDIVVTSGDGVLDKIAIQAELITDLSIKIEADGGSEVKLNTKALAGELNLKVDLTGGTGGNQLEWLVDSAARALTLGLGVNTTTAKDEVLLKVETVVPSERLAVQLDANTGASEDKLETILKSAAAVVDLGLAANTGAGNDQIKVELDQLIPAAVATNLNILLEAGNDSGEIFLKGSSANVVVNGLLSGGADNDTLTLVVEGAASGAPVVDGGAGQDSCIAPLGCLNSCGSGRSIGAACVAKIHALYLALVTR